MYRKKLETGHLESSDSFSINARLNQPRSRIFSFSTDYNLLHIILFNLVPVSLSIISPAYKRKRKKFRVNKSGTVCFYFPWFFSPSCFPCSFCTVLVKFDVPEINLGRGFQSCSDKKSVESVLSSRNGGNFVRGWKRRHR